MNATKMNEAGIYQAVNNVMKKVGYVKKEKSDKLTYTYAGEAALIAALRPAMIEEGIVVFPTLINEVISDNYETSRGTTMNRTIVSNGYRFAHVASGTHIDVPVLGEGADVGDKSANKAMTGAYKYALRQTFMIETGDDPDKTSSVEVEEEITYTPRQLFLIEKNIVPPNSYPQHIDNLIALAPEGLTDAELVKWGKLYRGERDSDDKIKPKEAAKIATEKYKEG